MIKMWVLKNLCFSGCLFAAGGLGLSTAIAQTPTCKLGGKVVDRFGPERKTFDGVMTCVRENQQGKTVEMHTFVKGHRIEESIDGPTRKEIQRFYPEVGRHWRHGEQLEYYPGTNKLKARGRYVKMHKVGLQEQFYESGKIKERTFWVQDRKDGGVTQTSGIGYRENGGIQYIRCSNSKDTTLDPKLCGFEGKNTVSLVTETGEATGRIVFERGVKIETETANFSKSEWAGASQRGTILADADVKLKREKLTNGEKLTWTYGDGKIKRVSLIDEKGDLTGRDEEFFPSGKPARVTVFENSKAKRSECWWENGKPKTKFERSSEKIIATFTWDTGVVQSSGSYRFPKTSINDEAWLNELVISCEDRVAGLEREGPFEYKRRDGTLEMSGEYKNGQPVGWFKNFDKSGVIETEEQFSEGTSQKPSRRISRKTYRDGNLTKEEKFNSDGSIQD